MNVRIVCTRVFVFALGIDLILGAYFPGFLVQGEHHLQPVAYSRYSNHP
jgi:hypothetical protein